MRCLIPYLSNDQIHCFQLNIIVSLPYFLWAQKQVEDHRWNGVFILYNVQFNCYTQQMSDIRLRQHPNFINILNQPKIHHPIGVDPEGGVVPQCLKCKLSVHLPNILNKVLLQAQRHISVMKKCQLQFCPPSIAQAPGLLYKTVIRGKLSECVQEELGIMPGVGLWRGVREKEGGGFEFIMLFILL